MYPEVDAGRLDDMRALLHRHKELLQDTAQWPVPHVVEQLAAQDLGAFVQHDETDGSGQGMCRLIECITPSSATGCRLSIQGDSAVHSVAFSPDMLKLASCVQFNPADAGQLVSGSDDKTVKVWSERGRRTMPPDSHRT
jgi:hypothetical protein